MKTLISLIAMFFTATTFAAPSNGVPARKNEEQKLTRAQQERIKKMGTAFGTNHQLRGSTIFGKTPSSGASTTTVENDKFLDDLIDARKDFSDREQRDAERL